MPFGKGGDDPLTSTRAATRWIESLPLGDMFKAQQAISQELKRFNEEQSSQYTRDRLPIFMMLDEKANDLQDTLVRQYLRNPRMSRPLESQLWHAVYGLYWEVARGYHAFVLHLTQDGARLPHDTAIPQITLRAIRSMGQLLKWRAIRYLPASEKLWLRLHNLYLIAEGGNFHRLSQRVYPGDETTCSCETAYLHLLMVDLANSGTLYPRQLDLLDRWLCGWHDMLHLDTDFVPDTHTFYVDLSADHGPRHVRKQDNDKPLRYWSTTTLLKKLDELLAALHAGHTAPSQLGLSSRARTSESLDLLHHLQHQWAPLATREQRRAPRAESKRLVDVAHGIKAIASQLKAGESTAASSYGTGLSYTEVDDVQVYGFVTDRTRERISHLHMPAIAISPDVERWVVHDESECGYGAIVESTDKDWLRVGTLVSIKPHDAQAWAIGIVRRISRVNDDTSAVGVETLPESPALVSLYETMPSGYMVNGLDSKNSAQPHLCLWLAGNNGEPDSLILDPVYFMPAKTVELRGLGQPRLLALGNPLEHSEGWMRVTVVPQGI
jgi:cyclic-di-GMP-binding protein